MDIKADKPPACPRHTAFYVAVVCVLVLETALLVGSTVWLQTRLVSLRSSVQEKARWLRELDTLCPDLVLTADSSHQEEAGGTGRERRQAEDLLQALLTTQQNLFSNLCNNRSHLCRAGQKGEPGLRGPPGPPGLHGEAGALGPHGDAGPNGTMGGQGPAGKTGPQGPMGDAGALGTPGLKGEPGLLGPKGITGDPGDVGAQGSQGSKGGPGLTGSPGLAGSQGLPGGNGTKGQDGLPGGKGDKGEQGDPGPAGRFLDAACLCPGLPVIAGNLSDSMEGVPNLPFSVECKPAAVTWSNTTVVWSRLDDTLPSKDIVHGNTLTIPDFSQKDAGLYRCTLVHSLGNVTRDVNVTIRAPTRYDCDFSRNTCLWRNLATDDMDWRLQSGSTASSLTGPQGDHTTGTGKYIYIETSGSLKQGSKALLVSPDLPANSTHCLALWYHMYGRDMGTLVVSTSVNGNSTQRLLWSKLGNQGNQWHLAKIEIPSVTSPSHVILEGKRGSSYHGDAAVDDITVSNGRCP